MKSNGKQNPQDYHSAGKRTAFPRTRSRHEQRNRILIRGITNSHTRRVPPTYADGESNRTRRGDRTIDSLCNTPGKSLLIRSVCGSIRSVGPTAPDSHAGVGDSP